MICTVSLNEPSKWTVHTQGDEMLKQYVIRGKNNQVFYGTKNKSITTGDSNSIIKLELNESGDMNPKKEVWKFQGIKILAFCLDNENKAKQAILVFDDKKKEYRIVE